MCGCLCLSPNNPTGTTELCNVTKRMTHYLRIKHWDNLYENSRSRKIENPRWVPIPNKHDGEIYSRIMFEPDGLELFAVWILILQVASKCHPRGRLVRGDGSPLDATAIMMKTRMQPTKKDLVERAISMFLQVAWLEQVKCESGRDVVVSYQVSAPEGKGIEGNRREKKEDNSSFDNEPSIEKKTVIEEKSYPTKKGRKIKGQALIDFNDFWDAFGYKSGKPSAADSWLDIPNYSRDLFQKIMAKAHKECKRRKDLIAAGRTPKMAQGWITDRRWEDEDASESTPKAEPLAEKYHKALMSELEFCGEEGKFESYCQDKSKIPGWMMDNIKAEQ